MAQNQFTRETYKKIKKMDRQQMEQFVLNVFQEGYRAATEEAREAMSGQEIDMTKLQNKIKEIKGIGEKKTEEIMRVIKECMEDTK